MPHGRVSPGQGVRYDNKPWEPGKIIGERLKKPVPISFFAAKKLPDYQEGMVDAAITADIIIFSLLRKSK